MKRKVAFKSRNSSDFYKAIRQEVDHYFQQNGLSRFGGSKALTKSILLLGAFSLCYFGLIFLQVPGVVALAVVALMGIVKAGIGMGVMHDAMHGTLSGNGKLNNLLANSLYVLGGNKLNWHIQHNLHHHTYPNIFNVDEDVSTKAYLIRLSPESPQSGIHRFQHLYAPFLYAFMTLSFFVKDFRQLFLYSKGRLNANIRINTFSEFFKLTALKVMYFIIFIGIPAIFSSYSLLQIVVALLIMHFTAGLILSIIFQLAHIVEETSPPQIDEEGNVANTWAIHQLISTSNFALKSRLLYWFSGGLNHQIEHHLFPNVCHVHYPALSVIVKKAAAAYNLPYNCSPTFGSALRSHFRMLKKLGQPQLAQ